MRGRDEDHPTVCRIYEFTNLRIYEFTNLRIYKCLTVLYNKNIENNPNMTSAYF
jgi:hypothetical protein